MRDYELILKIKNAVFLNTIRAHGYKTIAEFARASGINASTLQLIGSLQIAAYKNDGAYRKVVDEVIEFLAVDVTDLFPPDHINLPLTKNEFVAQVSVQQMEQLVNMSVVDPSLLIEAMERNEKCDINVMLDCCDSLTKREREVLLYRFRDDMTLDAIAEKIGRTRERIRQIEAKALRKLRHPRRSLPLKEMQTMRDDGIDFDGSEL